MRTIELAAAFTAAILAGSFMLALAIGAWLRHQRHAQSLRDRGYRHPGSFTLHVRTGNVIPLRPVSFQDGRAL